MSQAIEPAQDRRLELGFGAFAEHATQLAATGKAGLGVDATRVFEHEAEMLQALLTELALAGAIDDEASRCAVEPGGQSGWLFDELAVLPQTHEHLLRDVHGVRVATEHAPALGQDEREDLAVAVFEGVAVERWHS